MFEEESLLKEEFITAFGLFFIVTLEPLVCGGWYISKGQHIFESVILNLLKSALSKYVCKQMLKYNIYTLKKIGLKLMPHR